MNSNLYKSLGEEIEKTYRKVDYDEDSLPEISAERLSRLDIDFEFSLESIGDYLCNTSVQQTPELRFSNLPIVMYHGKFVEVSLYVWTDSSTSIHQHAFGGAFRVLQGSSIQTRYKFDEHQRINTCLLIGSTTVEEIELLSAGSVQQINSGKHGLVHRLFHLERPTTTLVIRDYHRVWDQPQYSIYPPHIAFAHFELAADDQVAMMSRILKVSETLDHSETVKIWMGNVTTLDFPRLYAVLVYNYDSLRSDEERQNFINAAKKKHPEHYQYLEEFIVHAKHRDSLIASRRNVHDPELRTFLALLLNVPDRKSIIKLIGKLFPGEEPISLCNKWLTQLSAEDGVSSSLTDLVRKADFRKFLFSNRLTSALPENPEHPDCKALFACVLDEKNLDDVFSGRSKEIKIKMRDSYQKLRQLPELKSLFVEQSFP